MNSFNKVVCFTGETFKQKNGEYHASQTSVSFVQEAFDTTDVIVVGGLDQNAFIGQESSIVEAKNFISVLPVASVKDFAIKSLTSKKWLHDYISKLDSIIDHYSEAIFWIRTPSPASVLFGLRCLKKGKLVINHICADSRMSWRDDKYNFYEKIAAFFLGKILFYGLSRICEHKNTILNLTTGDVLQRYSEKFSSNNTRQFVDLMVDKQVIVENKNDVFNVIFVGRCVPDKGIYELLDAVRYMSDVSLTYVGGGELDQLHSKINEYRLNDRVKAVGQINHQELRDYFQNTDCVVVPSKNSYEGFPRVIMESWAFGKIPIVSNVGGVNAFVKHEKNGLLIDCVTKEQIEKAILKIKNSSHLTSILKEGVKEQNLISNKNFWINQLRKDLEQIGYAK